MSDDWDLLGTGWPPVPAVFRLRPYARADIAATEFYMRRLQQEEAVPMNQGRLEIVRRRIRELEAEEALLSRFPTEDPFADGDIVSFKTRFPGSDTVYHYVAIRANGHWYTTDQKRKDGHTWPEFVMILTDRKVVAIEVVTGTQPFDDCVSDLTGRSGNVPMAKKTMVDEDTAAYTPFEPGAKFGGGIDSDVPEGDSPF